MIGASTFYNLGLGGDSNSGQSKRLYDNIDRLDLEGKDVLVLFLMTYSHRFSFYNEGLPQTVAFNNNPKYKHSNKLVEGYVEMISGQDNTNYDFNVICEQFYYLRTVTEFCKNRNFKFGWANVQHGCLNILYHMLGDYEKNTLLKNEINGYSFIEDLLNRDNHAERMSLVCGHPNEKGYKKVAERFFSAVSTKYPQFLKHKLEEKYNSESIQYEKIPLNREEHPLIDNSRPVS